MSITQENIFNELFHLSQNEAEKTATTSSTATTRSLVAKMDSLPLVKMKIPELKELARSHGLRISGTKKELIGRIQRHIDLSKSATKIQTLFRGRIVRYLLACMGPATKNPSLCVNDCDPCTLEPLSAIPPQRFFSFKDSTGTIYGFDIITMLSLYNKNNSINPYTRLQMDAINIFMMKRLCEISIIFFPYLFEESEREMIPYRMYGRKGTQSHERARRARDRLNTHDIQLYMPQYGRRDQNEEVNPLFHRIRRHPHHMRITEAERANRRINIMLILMDHPDRIHELQQDIVVSFDTAQRNVLAKIVSARCKPLAQRIRDLFIEIDLLGNYSSSEWFTSLSMIGYFEIFRYLLEIWVIRANLDRQMKRRICILGDPFAHHNMNIDRRQDNTYIQDETTTRTICISLMEFFVYGSDDVEYRKLGAMYVLTALTMVSSQARESLPWLYEAML